MMRLDDLEQRAGRASRRLTTALDPVRDETYWRLVAALMGARPEYRDQFARDVADLEAAADRVSALREPVEIRREVDAFVSEFVRGRP